MFIGDFNNFFNTWADDLWALVHFGRPSEDEFRDEFFEITQSLRKKTFRIIKSKKNLDPDWVANRFVSSWRKNLKKAAWRKARFASASKAEDAFSAQIIQFGLFVKKYSPKQVANWLGVTEKSLRFRALRFLFEFSGIEGARLKPLERDCVRHDLYFLDYHLNLSWEDPLELFSKSQFEKHINKCNRCAGIENDLARSIQRIQMRRIPTFPTGAKDEFLSALSSPLVIFQGNPFSAWPWYLKTPFQMATLGLLLYATLTVPYIGSFFPEFKTKQKELTESFSRGFEGTLDSISKVIEKLPTQIETPPAPEASDSQKPVVVAEEKPIPAEIVAPAPAQSLLEEMPTLPAPTPKPPAIPKIPVEVAQNKVVAPKVELAPARGERVFYRWGAFSSTLPVDTQKLVEVLSGFQAEKAGDLDLGAQYRGGSYFHFMILNENFDALVEAVKNSGITQFTNTRATSDRLTPPGKRRIVFLVKPQ